MRYAKEYHLKQIAQDHNVYDMGQLFKTEEFERAETILKALEGLEIIQAQSILEKINNVLRQTVV